jgi:predicted ATP-dependent endonuclease of OLD family
MTARTVVLVEGVSDRNAIEALAKRRGRDLSAEGISVVRSEGHKRSRRFSSGSVRTERT